MECSTTPKLVPEELRIDREMFDTVDDHKSKFIAKPGITEEIVRLIST
ncbi:hypothetical protein HYX12_02360, partial [Candidatus Woesearchaeota archaeon]|nr:hypothetical protein [Candidatus Woesearchaeota archaeon]